MKIAGGLTPAAARRIALVGRALCLVAAGVGAMGLIGWVASAPWLTTLVPGKPPMMPNTAFALVLIGIAGALRHDQHPRRVLTALSVAAAVVVLAVGVGTLAQYGLQRSLGIDQLLFRSSVAPYPGRPSPPTALALTLLGAALLVLDRRPAAHVRPSEWLILSAGCTAFASLLAIAFGAGELYRFRQGSVVGVALPTAAGLLLTSAGLLLMRPTSGLMRLATSPGAGGMMLRRLAPPALLAPVLFGVVVARVSRSLGLEGLPLVLAVVVSVTPVVCLLLLAGTAFALDRAHEELEASQTRIGELVRQASDGIFIADLDGRYTDVNDAGCRMLGYARDELIGKTIIDLIPPFEVERLSREKQRMLEGGTEVTEWTLSHKDGTWVPVEVSAKILPDGRWQGIVRDITERKRLEEELRQAIRARDEIMGVVAHDLRNPLGGILLQAQRLRRRGPEPERRSQKAVEAIERSATRMNRLIQDLLEVTRAEAGRLSVEQASISVGQVLAEAVEAQQPFASSASVDLVLEAATELPALWADHDSLLRVFENLVGNAIKFTAPGGRVTVGAARRQDEVLFWVADTGVGIPQAALAHVFDRFWQAPEGERRGAGLGLTIARNIVEAHGGRIWAESEPGRGSTFTFTVPTAPRAAGPRPAPAPPGPRATVRA